MGGRGSRFDPDLCQVDIQQSENVGGYMDKTITAISRFGSCPVFIVWAKANVNPLFSKFEILHFHAEALPNPESALFEHETQQAVTETRRVTVRVLSHMNAVDECLEILL